MSRSGGSIARLLDVLLPPLCVHCGRPLGSARPGLCAPCLATIRPLPSGCRRCGLPRPGRPAACGRCRDWPPGLEAVSATRYAGAAETAVRALKYGGWRHLADACAGPMARALAAHGRSVDRVVGVPLHPARLRERGFDQAGLLAGALAGRIGRPAAVDLVRVRATRSQVGLGRRARLANVAGAFRAARPAPGEAVALVDDVATSGATLAAAATALLEAGAERVVGVTFALAFGPARR